MEGQIHIEHDRLKGVLLGMAAGERNGGPTCMALELADSLIELKRFDADDILHRYLNWWQLDGFDAGTISSQVFSLMTADVPHSTAVDQVDKANESRSAGCNPAHRSLPLSMAAFVADNQLAGMAIIEASLTHLDPLAGDVAAATVTLCRQLILGEPWSRAITLTSKNRMPESVSALLSANADGISKGGYAPEVLKAAVYFVGIHDTFSDAIEASLTFAGPDNYCPVLVGAIGGARWGASSIDVSCLKHCKQLPRVYEISERLAGMWHLKADINKGSMGKETL